MDTAKMLLFFCSISFLLAGCMRNRPPSSGVTEGRLTPCPDSPNCVLSQSTDAKHRVEPLTFHGAPADALARLKGVIQSMKRTRLVEETDAYLHVEFRSALFGFVDDVEFSMDGENSLIHVRSASRAGYWDLGVNRRRVEAIREKML